MWKQNHSCFWNQAVTLAERTDTFLTSPTSADQPRPFSGCEEQRMVCCKHGGELHSCSIPGASQGLVQSCASQHTWIARVDHWWSPPNSPQSASNQPQLSLCPNDSWKRFALHKITEYTQDFPCLLILEHCDPHTICTQVTAGYTYSLALHCLNESDIWPGQKSPTASNHLGPNFDKMPLIQMEGGCIRDDYRTGPLWYSNVKNPLVSRVQLFPINLLNCTSQFILLIHCHAHYLSKTSNVCPKVVANRVTCGMTDLP